MSVLYLQCPYCGDEYPARRTSGFCGKEPCVLERVKEVVWSNVVKDGDCELWQGYFRQKGTAPILTMYIYRDDGTSYRKDYRVLQYREEHPEKAKGRVYENKCGNRACVNLDHHILHAKQPARNIPAKLPAQPLLDAVERYQLLNPERPLGLFTDRISQIRARGNVSVTTADAICIDLLGVHPYQVYGWDFYDAA